MPSLTNKTKFPKGSKVWFYGPNGLEKGTVIWSYRGGYIVSTPHCVAARTWREVWETKEEAEQNAKKA